LTGPRDNPLVSGPVAGGQRLKGQSRPGQVSDGPLGELALSRATVDRAAERRQDTTWIEQAWADPKTRVLVVNDSRALVDLTDGRHQLVLVSPQDAPQGTRFFLGVDEDEIAYFGVSGELPPLEKARSGEGAKALQLRQVGADLGPRDAGLLTHAVALANWHDTHTHCPRCGTPTVPAPAGHVTTCPKDGTEHFPRLDPAVIMLVIDPEDRLLLARNATWPPGRMSVLAGFVEPGESCEHAVAREVLEESSIVVSEVEYLGSQPWPMPRSLMLGFRAVTADLQEITIDEDEIGEARWFTRAELIEAIEARVLSVAPTSSIARRLIEYWYGAELPDFDGSWATPAR
jgi:NAD+ diphosphatase